MAWRLISAEANSECSAFLLMCESLLDMLKKKCINFNRNYSSNTNINTAVKDAVSQRYLSMTVRSLWYMVVSGWTEEGRRPCERPRLVGASWEVDKEARTLAAAEAAVLDGMKRWSRPCSPDAVRMGWARTLAKRFSGWKQQQALERQ